jgi:hypothetical protein
MRTTLTILRQSDVVVAPIANHPQLSQPPQHPRDRCRCYSQVAGERRRRCPAGTLREAMDGFEILLDIFRECAGMWHSADLLGKTKYLFRLT